MRFIGALDGPGAEQTEWRFALRSEDVSVLLSIACGLPGGSPTCVGIYNALRASGLGSDAGGLPGVWPVEQMVDWLHANGWFEAGEADGGGRRFDPGTRGCYEEDE